MPLRSRLVDESPKFPRQTSRNRDPEIENPQETRHPASILRRDASSLSSGDVLQLQSSIGNRATRRFLNQPRSSTVQLKALQGSSDTPQEREADAMAEGRSSSLGDTSLSGEGITVSSEVQSGIQQARGGGEPLSKATRAKMEQKLGADFSGVRVHTDDRADTLNQELLSHAFTTGQDIFFRRGDYSPDDSSGQKLLIHELTHTQQQAAAPQQSVIQPKLLSVDEVRAKVGINFKWRSGDYKEILAMYTTWHRAETGIAHQPVPVRVVFLKKLLAKINGYIGAKQAKQGNANAQARAARDSKISGMTTLKSDVEAELQGIETAYNQSEFAQRPALQDEMWGNVELIEGGARDAGMLNQIYEVGMDGDEDSERTGFFKPDVTEFHGGNVGTRVGIPMKDPNQSSRAVGVYRIDQLLGANLTPPTYKAKLDDGEGSEIHGSVMERIKNAKQAQTQMQRLDMGGTNMTAEHSRELNNLYLLDALIGQPDRHLGNVLVQGPKVWGIDNDLAFAKNLGFNAASGSTGAQINGRDPSGLRIDKEFAVKIINLSGHPDWVSDALEGLISPEELKKTLERLENLAKYLTKRLVENDRVVGEGGWDT